MSLAFLRSLVEMRQANEALHAATTYDGITLIPASAPALSVDT